LYYNYNPNASAGFHPVAYNNGMTHPYNLNHPEGAPRNDMKKSQAPEKDGHTHAVYGATTCQDKHTHLHPGVTSTPIQNKEEHVHKLSGNTTFDDGHIHYYEDYTSPPIPLPNGYHTHYAVIKTTKNDGHVHIIKGFTAPSKS